MEACLRSSELGIEAHTHVVTTARKLLAIAAINCKVDWCSRFSEC